MSTVRHASFSKAVNGKFYVFLGDQEHDEFSDSTAYGPFDSGADAEDYLSNGPHSNPGGWWGWREGSPLIEVPALSPNGRAVMSVERRRGQWVAKDERTIRVGPFIYLR